MGDLFQDCSSLIELNLPNLNDKNSILRFGRLEGCPSELKRKLGIEEKKVETQKFYHNDNYNHLI